MRYTYYPLKIATFVSLIVLVLSGCAQHKILMIDKALSVSNSTEVLKENSISNHITVTSLAYLRSQHKTLVVGESDYEGWSLQIPPKELFNKIEYPSGDLVLAAFVSPDPNDNKKHPAMIWLNGTLSNYLSHFWHDAPVSNDQIASIYRKSGVIMMYPTFRGGQKNLGNIEYNYSEVDDVIAAAEYLASLSYIDSNRIYLGGHNADGTLALLVSEVVSSKNPKLFREIISFGAYPNTYDKNYFDDITDFRLRSPALWTNDIKVTTLIIEGMQNPDNGNFDELKLLCNDNQNSQLKCIFAPNYNHFNVLFPVNKLIAQQILNNKPIEIKSSEF